MTFFVLNEEVDHVPRVGIYDEGLNPLSTQIIETCTNTLFTYLYSKEYMRMVSPIKSEWLLEVAPHYYQQTDIEDLENKKKMPLVVGKAAISKAE